MGTLRTLAIFTIGLLGGIYFGRHKDVLWAFLDLETKKKQWTDWNAECEKLAEEEEQECTCGAHH
jgi:hypothetical protein